MSVLWECLVHSDLLALRMWLSEEARWDLHQISIQAVSIRPPPPPTTTAEDRSTLDSARGTVMVTSDLWVDDVVEGAGDSTVYLVSME